MYSALCFTFFVFKFYFHLFNKFPFDVIYSWSLQFISLTASNSGTIQELPFGVNTTIELKNVTAASDNTTQLLVEAYPAR